MHKYRTHNCGELNINNVGQVVKISGWLDRKRDHGGILFIDLRDHYGITQIVSSIEEQGLNRLSPEQYAKLASISNESVITITGVVTKRSTETINTNISSGYIEIIIEAYEIQSEAAPLPITVNSDIPFPEHLRLEYRFLDLRKEKLHNNIILRSKIIAFIRRFMTASGFIEFQTPILTASSPEGARDFVVPSRNHMGKFYALPQAPQQFKQLLMISGFDRYFQIAPCFRDEDARADRAPGEFYQLDVEMAFVTQEDVFSTIEPLMYSLFTEFGNGKRVSNTPFERISYSDAMLKYGSDKPDLRNPIVISDVTGIFKDSDFSIFRDAIARGQVVRAIPVCNTAEQPRSFFDKMVEYAQTELGAKGLGYIQFDENGVAKGPVAKFLQQAKLEALKHSCNLSAGDAVFFSCGNELDAAKIAGKVRTKLAEILELIDESVFKFCWIVDFPFYEWNEEEQKLDFCHNPFSMPQGGMEALNAADTLEKQLQIKAYQYDIVCNGIELSSGAIRNHKPEVMFKAFELVGYSQADVESKFGAMIKAFKYGAPPHGGIAPGVDRMVMLLANEPNIREVIAFPLNQAGQDLLMGAPSEISEKQLRELHITLSQRAKDQISKKQKREEK